MSIVFQLIENGSGYLQAITFKRSREVESMHSILLRDGAEFTIAKVDKLLALSVMITMGKKTIIHDVERLDVHSHDILAAIDACISDAFYLFMNEKEYERVN